MSEFISVHQASLLWNLSERSVRNYCALGRVEGAVLNGKSWMIPKGGRKPTRSNEKENKNYLLERLRAEKKSQIKGGIYHKLMIGLTYNSNHIEGNELTHDETRYIYETRTILGDGTSAKKVDDIIETINHFSAIDRVIDFASYPLSERFIKELHGILKANTNDARLPYFAVGDYKRIPNEAGGKETTHPRLVGEQMRKLLEEYGRKEKHAFEEIIEFYVRFERIHPFQNGNGRVGRLIALKECLKSNIVPFIIFDKKKSFYYRGFKNYNEEKGLFIDACLYGQGKVKAYLDYFNIPYR